MAKLIRAFDWSKTPLGPGESWSQVLKTAVDLMLHSRYAMFVWWGRELTNLYNDAYRPFLGGKHPGALGQSAREVWAEIWDLIGPRTEAVLDRGEATFDEALLLVMERYGYPEETYFTFSYSPIRDDRGSVGGIFCAVTDTTLSIIGERRLKLLRDVAARAPEAHTPEEVCAAASACIGGNARDLPFALLYLSEADGSRLRLIAWTGIEPDSAAAPRLVPLQDPDEVWPFAEVLATGAPVVLEDLASRFEVLPKGAWDRAPARAVVTPLSEQGQTRVAGFLIAGLNPYLPYDEGFRGFIGLLAGQIAAAIANARAYEEERRRAEALAELDRAKTAFFSNVSHEFRTPLALILGPLEELLAARDPTLSKQSRGQLEIIRHSGLRLLKLVNTLLDFARIEAGRLTANFELTEIGGYTAELASVFRSAVEKAGLRLTIDCESIAAPVYVDRDMWEKIVFNLLSNAFKYTLDGEIAVKLRQERRAVVLNVRDTGTGIPEADLPLVFDRFHRVQGARGRTHEGTGIGLALVQELVRLHAGSVNAESAPGRGSTFTVRLPVGREHLPLERIKPVEQHASTALGAAPYLEEALGWLPAAEDAAQSLQELLIGKAAELPAAGAAARQRVLVVEDNADMRDYVRRLLAPRYETATAADGEEALAAIRRERPDLILSDVMMPKLDGFGLLRALRSDPALRDLPVVMLSARAGEEASVEGLEAGADDYLVKPFSARELLARIRSNLEMARVRREAARRERELRSQADDLRERALRESELQFRDLADLIPQLAWMARPDGRSYWFNRRWYEYTGKSPAEMEGLGWQSVHDPAVLPQVMERWQASLASGTPFEMVFPLRGADGRFRPFLTRVAPVRDASGQVVRWLGTNTDISAQLQAEETLRRANELLAERVSERTAELRASEGRFRMLVEGVVDYAIFLLDERGYVTNWNTGAQRIKGYSAVEIIGRHFSLFYTEEDRADGLPERALATAAQAGKIEMEGWRVRKDGQRFWAHIVIDAIRDGEGQLIGFAKITRDMTERRAVEEQLRQAQKMEAIGQLTGGVAHDFNNLLTVIYGNLETLLRRLSADQGELRRFAEGASRGAERAAQLTHRLLAFSRRQPLEPKPVSLNRSVAGATELLRRTLGESVTIETVLGAGLWWTQVDPNQLENVLLNLAVNARDAMPDGGKLTIETANTFLDESYVATQGDVAPGQYVMLAVSDTGTGMSRDVLARAFEPFFTTKAPGMGTGLGLSQVYGFMKQSGGHVKLYSEVGEGTTVKLYLPRLATGPAAAEESETGAIPMGQKGETILVVEDDDDVREHSVEILRELGYRVLSAPNGAAALRMLKAGPQIRMLFTDVGLPGGLNGRQLADEARRLVPALRVLFTSGYARDAIVHHGKLDPGVDLVVKPFTYAGLAAKIRLVLDRPAPPR